jgi:glutamine synthetase
MVKSAIVPACVDYQSELVDLLRQKKAYGGFDVSLEKHFLGRITGLSNSLLNKLLILENAVHETQSEKFSELPAASCFYRDKILTAMTELRIIVDELETFIAKKHWPFPIYAQILYSVI